MKKLLPFLLLGFVLGCSAGDDAMEEALAIRGTLLSNDCSFRCTVTTDDNGVMDTFTVDCLSDASGELEFTVVGPDSISGITGKIDGQEGTLVFEGQVLAFPLLAGGRISPVSAPWILMNTLKKGCITSVARTQEGLLLSIDDSYADDALNLEIWTDGQGKPVAGEISWQGRRVVSMAVEAFTYV